MFDNLLVEKYRPKTLDDLVLSKRNRQYFEQIKKKQEIPHLMFFGDPGIGKSTLAKIIVKDILDCQYLYINASSESGVDVIRNKVTNFAQTCSIDGKLKVVILDEIDGLSSVRSGNTGTSAQQALRDVIEEYAKTTRFIATCNYPSMVIDALDSRFQDIDLTPPYDMCVERAIDILKNEKISVPEEEKQNLVNLIKSKYPDIRKIIGEIQKNVFDGVLKIDKTVDNLSFAQKVFDRITSGKVSTVRKFVIDNEVEFSNNYHTLLRNMFDVIYNSTLDFNKKRAAMLIVANSMSQHNKVLDQEINAYSCMLELSEVI